MTQSKFSEEVTMTDQISKILHDFQEGVDLSRTKFYVCIKLVALFQQKLEEHDKEMFYDICSILEESQQRGEEVINYPELKKRLETLGDRK